jgi:hypothetical protein
MTLNRWPKWVKEPPEDPTDKIKPKKGITQLGRSLGFRGPDAKRFVVDVRCEKLVSPKWPNLLFFTATKVKNKRW